MREEVKERIAAHQFEISISPDVIGDMQRRIRETRWPDDLGNADWGYGVNRAYLQGLARYWADGYDWDAQQEAMNRFAHYRVEIDGVPVHFLYRPGKGPHPIPIILTHGWPWTFWDYQKVIGPLSDPAAYGGDPADAFDVVLPSLPGYGFSTPLRKTGVNYWVTADLWHQLMTRVLGFERYAAQGGDWGAMVTAQLGHKYASHLYGIQVSAPMPLDPFAGERPYALLGRELPKELPPEKVQQAIACEKRVVAHSTVHLLDPQTLAYGAHDSPVGMLAWILERLRAWSDCGGDVESRFSRDDILTKATLYWGTESFVSSIRFYGDVPRHPWAPAHTRTPRVEAPSGVSIFERDGAGMFQELFLPLYNVHRLFRHSSGGHFAPMEEPEAVTADIRATFRDLR